MDPINECYKFISTCEEPTTFDLITASSVGDLRLVQKFLNQSVNPNITNTSGWTSLMYAANYGHFNILRVLIDCGADVSLQDWENGRTALMLAASNGHTRCVEVLVNYGKADISQLDYFGKTAAYYATHFGHGNNKIIGRILGITITRNSRPITKVVHKPKIVITQTNGKVLCEENRTPLQFDEYKSPVMPFYHFATIKDSASNGSNHTPQDQHINGHNGFSGNGHSGNNVHSSHSGNIYNGFSGNGYSGHNGNGHSGHNAHNGQSAHNAHGSHNGQLSENGLFSYASNGQGSNYTPVLHVSSDLAVRRKRLLAEISRSAEPEPIGSPGKTGSPPLPNSLDQLLERLELGEYKTLFANNAIDLYVFLTLTDKDLKELGIPSIGHRRRMTAAQQRFRESIEIRNTQERFFADWLLNEREQLKSELEALRTANNTLNFQLQELQSKM